LNKQVKYFFLLCFVFLARPFTAQNETKKWYFGVNAGLDFTSNPPTILTNGSMTAQSGCASVADASGNLLFYTNGGTVWDQGHNIMANGTGLVGNNIDNSTILIAKQPASSNIYYIFMTDGGSSFCYSIVDMNLAAGIGSVTVKNATLYAGPIEPKLAATKNCNGMDYWIVMREQYHSTTNPNPNFRAYSLTFAGISTVATTSSSNYSSNAGNDGVMRISPNGKKLAISNQGAASYMNSSSVPAFELYDFNNSTGAITNSISLMVASSLPTISPSYTYGLLPFGVEFSPDGTKLYGSVYPNQVPSAFSSSPATTALLQWDLCAGSNTSITNSQITISTQTIVAALSISFTALYNSGYSSLQLAPDGKIYMARVGLQTLDVINNPNLSGSSCNYVQGGQSIAPKTSKLELPGFIDSYFIQPPQLAPFTYTGMGCTTVSFTAPPAGCPGSGNSLSSILWDFGDQGSGGANTSTLTNPSHVFSALGTYTVKLILYYSCNGLTDTLKQTVSANQLCMTVNSHTITCANLGSATVTPSNGIGPYTYTWLPTSQNSSVATNLSPGTYTIFVHDAGNSITTSTTVVFTSTVPLTGTLSATASLTCFGINNGTATVNNLAGGSGNQYYLWTNGATNYTTSFVNTLSAGSWSVTVTDALTSCVINSVFPISQPPSSTLNLTASTPTACASTNIVLIGTNSGGTPGYSYTWTAGAISNTNSVSQSVAGTYVYTLNSKDANNCLTSNTISADFIANPLLSVADVSICPLEVGTLSISGATSYTWNGNSVGGTYTDSPVSSQQYTVVGSALSCTSLATPSIILKPLPIPVSNNNSPRCNGDNLVLNGGGGVSYFWSGPVSFTSSLQNPNINPVLVSNGGVYNLTVTAANNCTASISRTIVVNPQPTLAALGSTVCTSGTLNLSASSFTGVTYLWSGPPNFTSNLQNPSIQNPPINSSGAYTINVTSAVGCTNSAVVQASVTSPPSLTVSLSGSGTLCAQALNGSSNTITLTSSGANTYTLTTPNYLYNVNPNGPSSPLISQPPYQNSVAIAIATLVGSNDVCSAVTTVSFSIIPNPTLSISSPTPIICAGKSYTYTNQGATSYSWAPGTPGLSTYTGPVTVASPTVTSVYSVIGGSLGCNSGTQTSTITVYPLPTISIVPSTPTICLNSKINLIAGGAVGYTWFPNVGLNTPNDATVSSSPPSEQNYTVIGTSINNCTNTAQVTVSVLPLPIPIANASKSAACVNETIILTGFGGTEYAWSGPSNFYQEGQQITIVARSVYSSGIYTLTVIDKNGCKAPNTVAITIYQLPEGSVLPSTMQHCVPFCSDFNYVGITSTSPVTTKWTLDNKLFSQKSFSYCFTQAGDYIISAQLLDTSTNCINTKTFVVNAYPVPVADFTVVPEKPVESLDEVFFENTSQGTELNKWN
jgi:hypothetical protein